MIEKVENEVKQEFNESHPDFKIALKICCAMFHEDFFNPRNGNFSNHTYMSVCRTITLSLERYGLEAFYYIENDCLEKSYDIFGKVEFSPKLLLNFFKEKKEEIKQFKKQIIEDKVLNIEYKENELLENSSANSLIPKVYDESRVIPNVFLRSSLFGIVKKGKREFLKNKSVFSFSQYEILYTGEELDQLDLIVWDSLVYLFKYKNKEKETENISTTLYEICNIAGYNPQGNIYKQIFERIKRLNCANVEIKFNKKKYVGNLLLGFFHDENKNSYSVKMNKNLINIFSNNKDYTYINSKVRDELGQNQLAIWLFHFYESHLEPISFTLEYLKELSGSGTSQKEFNRMIKNSLKSLKNIYTKYGLKFHFDIKKNELSIDKKDTSEVASPIHKIKESKASKSDVSTTSHIN
ncbi:MAG: RepB family plasmid replication initiator protein [Silvanigrellaceae bacterium]|nr:RepB family plasmid replication initiator protein [Silvanigrellaceae bacterium]